MGPNASILSLSTMSSLKRPGKTTSPPRTGGKIAPEESELWDEITKSVTPLSLKKRNLQTRSINGPSSPGSKRQDQRIHPTLPPALKLHPTEPTFEHGKAPGLDRKTQTRMRRGQVQIDGRLDLHGLTQNKAHHQLLSFIENAYHDGRKSVLVITGKGTTLDGQVGVLRRAVPRWLNEPPLNAWIKGFDYAARGHGGEGALYILIRRKR